MNSLSHLEKKKKIRYMVTICIFLCLIFTTFLLSMDAGLIHLSPIDVLKVLVNHGTSQQELILFDFRLPRIVISLLVGSGLAVSGAILQGITRNSLADPGILGINVGAGLVVVLFISFFSSMQVVPVFALPFAALMGAVLTATLIYILTYKKGQGLSPMRMILIGIAVASGIEAALIVLTIHLDPRQLQFVTIWLAGSIWGTNWNFVLTLLPWILILMPLAFSKARVLNILNLYEDVSKGLGMAIEKERLILLGIAVGLAGSCVAVGGNMGFVGLIGPHLARKLVGPKHQFLLPASALSGSLLLIVADTLARLIVQPSEIPTGILVSIIGAPYFLYLLAKSKA